MNYLPSKGGVSENYNPQMIMNINKLDYHKYCNITFDVYVQALNQTKKTNTQNPRKIDTIYLTVNLNQKGGYMVMNLKYGLAVNRRKFTEIPVKNLVI